MGRDTGKTESEEGVGNHDDLVMSLALALVGTRDAFSVDSGNLIPHTTGNANDDFAVQIISVDAQKEFIEKGGPSLLMPMASEIDELPDVSAQRELEKYMMQLGGIPISDGKPVVNSRKYFDK
jgi:hypothetical protein